MFDDFVVALHFASQNCHSLHHHHNYLRCHYGSKMNYSSVASLAVVVENIDDENDDQSHHHFVVVEQIDDDLELESADLDKIVFGMAN